MLTRFSGGFRRQKHLKSSVIGAFGGKLDMLTATGDEGGDGSGLFTAIGSGSPGVFAVLLRFQLQGQPQKS
jgi:hypothetical protein